MDYIDQGNLAWLQPAEVLSGTDNELAEFFGVTARTIRTWKKTNRAPLMALRLMRLRFDGDLSALGGKHWEHFRFGRDGMFYMPGWKYGWTPGELCALFFRVQSVKHWEREAKKLDMELVKLREQAWAAGKVRETVRVRMVARGGVEPPTASL